VDPYCYPGTTILKNIPGLREQSALDRFEAAASAQRAEEPLPAGRLSVHHFQAMHRHLFQDVYRWAGRFRTVRISKGASMFCFPEHIEAQMSALFADLRARRFLRGLDAKTFAASAAHILAMLNAIHAFRDGNGRTQLAFLALSANRAGHPLTLQQIDADAFLAAMIASFHGDERPLSRQIFGLIAT
jgi:cell filamentation protein